MFAGENIMADTSTCFSPKCGTTVEGTVAKCPTCGKRMRMTARLRITGWFLLIVGLFLVGFMGVIMYNLAPIFFPLPGRSATDGSTFTGTADQARMIFQLFGVVIAFGVTTMINGGWLIKTGRRSILLTIATIVLAAGLLLLAFVVTNSLKS